MDAAEIAECLQALDAAWDEPHVVATSLEYRGGGGSGAWTCEAHVDGATRRFVVKARNNRHDVANNPLKVVPTELICARLGCMIDPPCCPVGRIIQLPLHLTQAQTYPGTADHPSDGSAFASEEAPASLETKGPFNAVPPAQAARLLSFQTWLRSDDAALLLNADTGNYLSFDHGWYLTGANWNWAVIDAAADVSPAWQPAQLGDPARLADKSLFDPTLEQILGLPDEAVVSALACLPAEWGLALDQRVRAAGYILRRRVALQAALAAVW